VPRKLGIWVKVWFSSRAEELDATLNVSHIIQNDDLITYLNDVGARGGVVVKALRYKPAGRGFDSRWCHWNFSVT